MKNKIFSTSDSCKLHKSESEFICSCGDFICFSCIESHKTHNDFVLKTKKNIFQELNNEIKELELNYEYISNSFQQEKILIKLVKDLTKKFFRKEIKNSKDKEILKILSEMKISLNRANLEYKYEYRYPDNFEIKSIKSMIEKAKRNFIKKLNKIQKSTDRILISRNFFETEYEKLLRRVFSTDDIKMDVDENESKHQNIPIKLTNKIDNFQFTIGATKAFSPEATDKIFSPLRKEFVQSFYSEKETEKNENFNFADNDSSSNKTQNITNRNSDNHNIQEFKKSNFEEIEFEKNKNSTGIKSRNDDIQNIQIPIVVSTNPNFGSEIYDDKIIVGKEVDNRKDIVMSSLNTNSNYNNYNSAISNEKNIYLNKYKNGEDTRPTSISNMSRSPIRNKSPLQKNRVNSVLNTDSEIDMVCFNPNCRRSYKVKRGEEKWKKKCLTCYKIEKA